MKKKFIYLVIAITLSFCLAGLSNATEISSSATDLTDINIGEDLWEYSFIVSDNSFDADTGFTIYFDLGLYALLDPFPVAPNSGWDIITWDPDPSIPDDGAYDAYALIDNASLDDAFVLSFAWLGGIDGPGSQTQYFEVYDAMTWTVIEVNNTSPAPVPEPSTLFLFGVGFFGFIGRSYMKRFKK